MNATGARNTAEKRFSNLLGSMRADPRISVIVASAFAVTVVVALILWAKTPDYRVLFNHLTDEDGGAIVNQLTQMNTPYRFAENGGALMVPADKVHELRLKLAQQGLPKGGGVGFELLDKEKFGISQFSEQVNYQRALEGELARTIETFGPVKSARIHLALPKPSLFVREQRAPSASVTLNLQPGRTLDAGHISAVVHMVSSSIAGLPPGNVTVVDQAGRLLTHADAAGRDLNDAQLKYAFEVESRYQQRIEAILSPILGQGNVHAQVTAQIDFDRREQTDEQYKPNSDPASTTIRSRQNSMSEQPGGYYPGGVPGALSNQPAPANTAPIETANDSKRKPAVKANNTRAGGSNTHIVNSTMRTGLLSTRKDDTINYEVDRTLRHTKRNVGNVKRLSVAVVVNYRTDEQGQQIALTAAQIKQIEELTREAMGFSTERGDSINVANSPFTRSEVSIELPFWQQQSFFEQLMTAGRGLLIALVAWLLYRKLIRPLLLRKPPESIAADAASAAVDEKQDDTAYSVALSKNQQEQEQGQKSQHRANAEMMSQRIRKISENDPRVVAMVVRQWMGNEQ